MRSGSSASGHLGASQQWQRTRSCRRADCRDQSSGPPREECAICTAVAPEPVFTVRTDATAPLLTGLKRLRRRGRYSSYRLAVQPPCSKAGLRCRYMCDLTRLIIDDRLRVQRADLRGSGFLQADLRTVRGRGKDLRAHRPPRPADGPSDASRTTPSTGCQTTSTPT